MRLLWMDRLRGAAIIAVVLLHAELSARGASGQRLPLVHGRRVALIDALFRWPSRGGPEPAQRTASVMTAATSAKP